MKTAMIRFAAFPAIAMHVAETLILAAVACLLASCSADDMPDGVKGGLQPVSFVASTVNTRTTLGETDATGSTPISWADYDYVYICSPQAYSYPSQGYFQYCSYMVDNSNVSDDYSTATFTSGDNTLTYSDKDKDNLYWSDSSTPHTFYGFYPIASSTGTGTTGIQSYGTGTVSICQDAGQSNAGWTTYPMLYGKSESVSQTSDAVALTFKPIQAVLHITLTNSSLTPMTIYGIGAQVEDSDGTLRKIAGDFTLTLADGTVSGGTMTTVYNETITTRAVSANLPTREWVYGGIGTTIAADGTSEAYLAMLLSEAVSTADKMVIYIYCAAVDDTGDDLTCSQYYKVKLTPNADIDAVAPNGKLYEVGLEYKGNAMILETFTSGSSTFSQTITY